MDHRDRSVGSSKRRQAVLSMSCELELLHGHPYGRSAEDMLAGLHEGQILVADRGYDSDDLRARLARQGAWGNIKPMPNRVSVPSFSAYLRAGAVI